jgi:hypothetical protein
MTDEQQRNALTAAGVPLEKHEAHEDCATQLGHRVRALASQLAAAERRLGAAMRGEGGR